MQLLLWTNLSFKKGKFINMVRLDSGNCNRLLIWQQQVVNYKEIDYYTLW